MKALARWARSLAKALGAREELSGEPSGWAQRLARAASAGDVQEVSRLWENPESDLSPWEWAADDAPGLFVELARAKGHAGVDSALTLAIEKGRLDWVEPLSTPWSDAVAFPLRSMAAKGDLTCVAALMRAAPIEVAYAAMRDAMLAKNSERVGDLIAARQDWSVAMLDDLARHSMGLDWDGDFAPQPRKTKASMEMFLVAWRASGEAALPRALERVISGRHSLLDEDRLEAARLLASPETISRWETMEGGGGSLVARALRARDLELAQALARWTGADASKDARLVELAFEGGCLACAAWALEVGAFDGARALEALKKMPSGSPELVGWAGVLAAKCSPSELAQAAAHALASGHVDLVKTLLPLCQMEHLGPLAVGLLARGQGGEEFGKLALEIATGLAQRDALDAATPGAGASRPARL